MPVSIDADSTIIEVHGHAKQGASYGYTRRLGYYRCWPPVRAPARCCTPASALGAHTARGMVRFVDGDGFCSQLARDGDTRQVVYASLVARVATDPVFGGGQRWVW
jgi:hypothetical protein